MAERLQEKLAHLPDKPGAYMLKGAKGRDRVRWESRLPAQPRSVLLPKGAEPHLKAGGYDVEGC